jgi:hypothetical protein
MDLSWNYAAESQAYDRVHRLGQEKDVFVKRLVVENTIEERLLRLQDVKMGTFYISLFVFGWLAHGPFLYLCRVLQAWPMRRSVKVQESSYTNSVSGRSKLWVSLPFYHHIPLAHSALL